MVTRNRNLLELASLRKRETGKNFLSVTTVLDILPTQSIISGQSPDKKNRLGK